MEKQQQAAQALLGRGYRVTESPAGGLLVEKKTFWGHIAYHTKSGSEQAGLNKRTWALMFLYGVGVIGAVYWYASRKGNIKGEIISLASGV